MKTEDLRALADPNNMPEDARAKMTEEVSAHNLLLAFSFGPVAFQRVIAGNLAHHLGPHLFTEAEQLEAQIKAAGITAVVSDYASVASLMAMAWALSHSDPKDAEIGDGDRLFALALRDAKMLGRGLLSFYQNKKGG